jgi:predicted nucleic acid-binding protein
MGMRAKRAILALQRARWFAPLAQILHLALRRRARDLNVRERALTGALPELIREGRVKMMGAIPQELLSGIREEEKFVKLRNYPRAFDEPGIDIADYEEAAHMHNLCRARGIAGSAIDFLICAVAQRREWHISTTHRDFVRTGECWGLGCLPSREANRDTSGAKAHMN